MNSSKLYVNGKDTGCNVDWKTDQDGCLIEIGNFMKGVGGKFTPVKGFISADGDEKGFGITAQYGDRIGFSGNVHEKGMVQVQVCEMSPKSETEDGRFFAPEGFLGKVLNGSVKIDTDNNIINVSAKAAKKIGDTVFDAKLLADAFEDLDYTVLQGGVCKSDAINVCYAGYSPDANGNNANKDYFCIQAPVCPGQDHAVMPIQLAYTMRKDEGFIIIGKTPPSCDYFSYRSYFLNRCKENSSSFVRKKIYTQLGDPINNYNINDDMVNCSPPKSDKVYESTFVLISTADKNFYNDALTAIKNSGIDVNNVLLDVIDTSYADFDNGDFSDMLNFLHRFSNPVDENCSYSDNPTLEMLRITPNKTRTAETLSPFPKRERGSGKTEDKYLDSLNSLRMGIIEKYKNTHHINELETQTWLDISGKDAVDAMVDVLGETRDCLYLRSEDFVFNEDTIVIVYGVNHPLVPKSVYSSVSCYGSSKFNGFGGITNKQYSGDVTKVFPELKWIPDVNMLYTYKFARHNSDGYAYSVPEDINNNLKGINNGDKAFMGFRNYIDLNSADKIGPSPDEILFDRAVVLTPIEKKD